MSRALLLALALSLPAGAQVKASRSASHVETTAQQGQTPAQTTCLRCGATWHAHEVPMSAEDERRMTEFVRMHERCEGKRE